MDIEQLNKTQIILLTLLVSFVTSIATGIVTVSLVNQAPQGITQTVNRIVERTIEKVVPEPAAATLGTSVVRTEKTVVVREDDLAAQSIEKLQESFIRIIPKGSIDAAVIARGIVIGPGLAITDKGMLDFNTTYEAILPGGKKAGITLRPFSSGSPAAILELALPEGVEIPSVVFADANNLKLGQSVIRLGGKARDAAAVGTVASLPDGSEGRGVLIETNITSATPGSILTTLFGEVVGMTTVESLVYGGEFYIPIQAPRPAEDKKTAQ